MKKMLIKRIGNLLTIKSILTISLMLLFIYLSIRGVNNEQVNNIFTTLIGFYFGSKMGKDDDNDNDGTLL